MRIGSLFSGIGGLELGLEWAGVGHAVWQVERESFCQSVLARWWPDAIRFDDVCAVGAHNLPPVDVICGGFPCQDISYAGKGAGLAGERSGLWFEYARIIREMGPRFVVVENVAALRARGLDQVLGTLASLGYDAEWRSIRASDVGATHQRERLFIVAYAARMLGDGCNVHHGGSIICSREGEGVQQPGDVNSGPSTGRRSGTSAESVMGRIHHGLPDRVDRWPSRPGETQAEWEPPRTNAKGANHAARLKALGNAVVPQVAAEVGRWLLEVKACLDRQNV